MQRFLVIPWQHSAFWKVTSATQGDFISHNLPSLGSSNCFAPATFPLSVFVAGAIIHSAKKIECFTLFCHHNASFSTHSTMTTRNRCTIWEFLGSAALSTCVGILRQHCTFWESLSGYPQKALRFLGIHRKNCAICRKRKFPDSAEHIHIHSIPG